MCLLYKTIIVSLLNVLFDLYLQIGCSLTIYTEHNLVRLVLLDQPKILVGRRLGSGMSDIRPSGVANLGVALWAFRV